MAFVEVLESPFFYRKAIKNQAYFFGRQRETHRIIRRFILNGEALALVGPRRIGKSSLLFHLCAPAVRETYGAGDYALIYIDCQELAGNVTKSDVYRRLLEEMYTAVGEELLWPAVQAISYLDFEREVRHLTRRGARLVFLFDEFEVIATNHHLDKHFFTELRSLSSKDHVNYIVASTVTLSELTFHDDNILTSPFFNVFSTLRLGLMPPYEATQLIEGLNALVNFDGFDTEETAFVSRLGGRHPFFLQIACDFLFEAKQARPGKAPDPARVRHEFDNQAEQHFLSIWHGLSHREQWALRRISHNEPERVRADTFRQLEDNCLIDNGRLFSEAFQQFVQRQKMLTGSGRYPVNEKPPNFVGDIRPEHRQIARQILNGKDIEIANFQLLTDGHSNFGIYLVKLKPYGQEGRLLEHVLKFASARDIQAEAHNYEEFVENRLRIGLQGKITSWFPPDIEYIPKDQWRNEIAAAMSLYGRRVGDMVFNFQNAYRHWVGAAHSWSHTAENDPIQWVLRRLFTELDAWQKQVRPGRETRRLRDEYGRLIRKLARVERSVAGLRPLAWPAEIAAHPMRLREVKTVAWAGRTFVNPIHWVHQCFNQPDRLRALAPSAAYRPGIVHGDLHFRNILVEHDDDQPTAVWLIDFSDTHQGHLLRDFGTLEADLKLVVTAASAGHFHSEAGAKPPILALEEALVQPDYPEEIALEDAPLPAVCRCDPQLAAVYHYIRLIRREAQQRGYLAEPDLRLYYFSLLHATLPIVYYDALSDWQRLHAFLSAALLCEKIDRLTRENET